jgi:hypothetical protein
VCSSDLTVTNNGVTFSDTIKKFGSHSGVFNGTTAYLSIPDDDDFTFGSGDFTIDMWIRFTSVEGIQVFANQGDDNTDLSWFLRYNNTNNLQFYYTTDGISTIPVSFSWTPSIDVWYHVAIIRNNSDIKAFINGLQIGSTYNISTTILYNTSAVFEIGKRTSTTFPTQFFSGYIDEVRVSKGIARWTSNFSVPISEYISRENMTLKSNAQVAENVPTSARIVLFEEDVDLVTLNTDLKAYISRNNGTTYSQVILEDEGNYITGARVLSGIVDLSSQSSDNNIKYKLETLNNKNLKIHGTGISWK